MIPSHVSSACGGSVGTTGEASLQSTLHANGLQRLSLITRPPEERNSIFPPHVSLRLRQSTTSPLQRLTIPL